MEDTEDASKSKTQRRRDARNAWQRVVDYFERETHKRKRQKKEEQAEIEAAKKTARATVWIAILTFALTGIGWLQWQEVQDSSNTFDRMNRIYRSQAAQLDRQANETKELVDRMKDQADQTKTIAGQAVIQANAAKDAANIAKDALHVSERAYIIAGVPTFDPSTGSVALPLINSGHLPSGKVHVIIHEATLPEAPNMRPTQVTPLEAHWRHYDFDSLPPTMETGGIKLTIYMPVPAVVEDQFNKGMQETVIVGTITYNDGFRDTVAQELKFCEAGFYSLKAKQVEWVPCDWSPYMDGLAAIDGYPNNEQPN